MSPPVERHARLPSTNDRASVLARSGAPSGTVVVADEQTAGKGQRGARWASPAQSGLYASFVLRPRLAPEAASLITLAAGVAVVDAVETVVPGAVGLEWPNDLLVRSGPKAGAKLAGILVEASLEGDTLNHAVVGVGINLKAAPKVVGRLTAALDELADRRAVDREALLEALSKALSGWLGRLEVGATHEVIDAWMARALGVGAPAEIEQRGVITHGRFVGLALDGGAVLALSDGGERTFWHGHLRVEVVG